MKKEYDFSNAERGKLYRPGARLNLPERAQAKGIEIGDLVNEALEERMDLEDAGAALQEAREKGSLPLAALKEDLGL